MRKRLLLLAAMFGGPLYCPFNPDFTDPTVSLDTRISFSRAGAATRTDPYGAVETIASGVARAHAYQQHDPLSYTTSATSNSVGRGSRTFAVSYAYTVGDTVRATYDNSNYMVGKVTAATGASVTIDVVVKVGSGTYTSWHVIRCLGFYIEELRTNGIRNNTMQGAAVGVARSAGTVSSASRSGSTTVVVASTGHTVQVGDMLTCSGASVSAYNGTFYVSAVVAGVSYSYVVASSATDSASGFNYSIVSPGTLPNNWTLTLAGMAYTVVAVSTANGVEYIRLRLAGLTNNVFANIAPEQTTQNGASLNSAWSHSGYVAHAGGSLSNISAVTINAAQWSSAPAYLTEVGTPTSIKSSLTSTRNRFSVSGIASNASVAYVQPYFQLQFSSGILIDVTIDLGLPQLEAGFAPSTVIKTTIAAVSRPADTATSTGTPLTSWYNQTEGTIAAKFRLTAVGSAGAYPGVVSFDDGTANNAIHIFVNDPGADQVSGEIWNSAATEASWFGGAAAAGAQVKAALMYKLNNSNLADNGVARTADTNCIMPAITTMRIGRARGPGGAFLNGGIERLSYYRTRLPNANAQVLPA